MPERFLPTLILWMVEAMEINEGKNVTEVLAAVTQGSNEVGVVYATDAASVADQVEIIAEASSDMLETPVLYPVGMIEDEEALPEEKVAAETFFEYLQTENALKVLKSMDSVLILLKWKRTTQRKRKIHRQIRKLTQKQKKPGKLPLSRRKQQSDIEIRICQSSVHWRMNDE